MTWWRRPGTPSIANHDHRSDIGSAINDATGWIKRSISAARSLSVMSIRGRQNTPMRLCSTSGTPTRRGKWPLGSLRVYRDCIRKLVKVVLQEGFDLVEQGLDV